MDDDGEIQGLLEDLVHLFQEPGFQIGPGTRRVVFPARLQAHLPDGFLIPPSTPTTENMVYLAFCRHPGCTAVFVGQTGNHLPIGRAPGGIKQHFNDSEHNGDNLIMAPLQVFIEGTTDQQRDNIKVKWINYFRNNPNITVLNVKIQLNQVRVINDDRALLALNNDYYSKNNHRILINILSGDEVI